MGGYQKWEMDNQWISGCFSKIHNWRVQKKSNNQFQFINAVLQNLKTKRFFVLQFVFKTRSGGYFYKKTSNTDLIAIVTEMSIVHNSPIQLIQLSRLKNDECHT
jgi:hypothetical protein